MYTMSSIVLRLVKDGGMKLKTECKTQHFFEWNEHSMLTYVIAEGSPSYRAIHA